MLAPPADGAAPVSAPMAEAAVPAGADDPAWAPAAFAALLVATECARPDTACRSSCRAGSSCYTLASLSDCGKLLACYTTFARLCTSELFSSIWTI